MRKTLPLLAVAALAACQDAIAPPSPAEADAPLAARAAVPAAPIPGQYIVVLREPAPGALGGQGTAAAASRLTRGRGTLRHTYSRALPGFAVSGLSTADVAALRADPSVAYVEQDQVVTIATTQSNATWGLDRIDQRALPLNGTYVYTPTGAGVSAYIVDTGIRFGHAEFGGRAVSGYDAVDGGSADDCNGHGTHVAGTVGGATYGVAKAARLVGVRVLDCNGSGTNSGVIAGMDWVASNRALPAVVNMSLGGGASTAVDAAVARLTSAGVTVVVAAGNSSANACNSSPARAPDAITVGSTTSSDARSSFSNYGSCLDIFAPGSSIRSAWHTSNTATNTISGTSMAAPHVAGVAALHLQGNTGASPGAVTSAIVNSATTGAVSNPGSGSPNRLLYSPLTGGGGGGGGGGAPCTGCTAYSGSLSGTGASQYQPGGSYYQSTVSGTHRGWLQGPGGTDFDLYLQRWNGAAWSTVASSISSTSTESIAYSGSAGYYRWRVYSYSGSGSYQFWLTRP